MRIAKPVSMILGAALLVAAVSGCGRMDLEDAAYAGGKLIYDTLKVINTPPED